MWNKQNPTSELLSPSSWGSLVQVGFCLFLINFQEIEKIANSCDISDCKASKMTSLHVVLKRQWFIYFLIENFS